jgi:hypothetical protein
MLVIVLLSSGTPLRQPWTNIICPLHMTGTHKGARILESRVSGLMTTRMSDTLEVEYNRKFGDDVEEYVERRKLSFFARPKQRLVLQKAEPRLSRRLKKECANVFMQHVNTYICVIPTLWEYFLKRRWKQTLPQPCSTCLVQRQAPTSQQR